MYYIFQVMWDFEGILRYSPMFYGYFSNKEMTTAGYPIPLAYFCSGMAVYIFRYNHSHIKKYMSVRSKLTTPIFCSIKKKLLLSQS